MLHRNELDDTKVQLLGGRSQDSRILRFFNDDARIAKVSLDSICDYVAGMNLAPTDISDVRKAVVEANDHILCSVQAVANILNSSRGLKRDRGIDTGNNNRAKRSRVNTSTSGDTNSPSAKEDKVDGYEISNASCSNTARDISIASARNQRNNHSGNSEHKVSDLAAAIPGASVKLIIKEFKELQSVLQIIVGTMNRGATQNTSGIRSQLDNLSGVMHAQDKKIDRVLELVGNLGVRERTESNALRSKLHAAHVALENLESERAQIQAELVQVGDALGRERIMAAERKEETIKMASEIKRAREILQQQRQELQKAKDKLDQERDDHHRILEQHWTLHSHINTLTA